MYHQNQHILGDGEKCTQRQSLLHWERVQVNTLFWLVDSNPYSSLIGQDDEPGRDDSAGCLVQILHCLGLSHWHRGGPGHLSQGENCCWTMKIFEWKLFQTTPEVAMSRVKSRNRQEEMEIPAEFFYNIHHLHEDWLIRRNSSAGVVTPQVSDEII